MPKIQWIAATTVGRTSLNNAIRAPFARGSIASPAWSQ
jgi:hypothetical protein